MEDDPNSGSDHLNALRLPVFMVGPSVKRRYIGRTLYTQVSVLRTIEALLGTESLSLFDAGAPGLWDAFANRDDFTPFTHISGPTLLTRNPGEKGPRPFAIDRQDPEAFETEQWLATAGAERSRTFLAYKQRAGIKTAANADEDDR
jgi:hypothetical protein